MNSLTKKFKLLNDINSILSKKKKELKSYGFTIYQIISQIHT